jgi:hypothetical protein
MYSKTRSIAWVIGTPRPQAILRSVRDDSKLNSGVYAIGRSPPFKTQKTICRRTNGPLLLKMVLMKSVDFVVKTLYDPLIGKAEKPFILQVDDQVLMYLDADNVCRLDDFPCNLQIIWRGIQIA